MKEAFRYIALGVVRLVLGLTFLFSGAVKLIDPRGTQYKIEDYGSAFGLSGLLPEGLPLVLACVAAMREGFRMESGNEGTRDPVLEEIEKKDEPDA